MAIWKEDFVKINEYTRPNLKLLGVKGIVVHYTATPGATAKNERDYFNGTCITAKRYASAHLFVDKNEARLIIPLDEVAYHANEKACRVSKLSASTSYYKGGGANLTSIGVEMCIEKDGSLHPDTLKRTIQIVTELCKKFNLNQNDIYRHYDITGKNCPAFWVSNPAGFTSFKKDIGACLSGKTVESKPAEVSKPKDEPKKNTSKSPDKKAYIQLPKTADTWRIYPLDKSPTKGNEKGMLKPSKFGGLTYEILGETQANVYIIQTSDYGKVQIYAAPSTGAKVVGSVSQQEVKKEPVKQVPKKKYVSLPKTDSSWRVYPLGKPCTKGNEKGYLNPKKFGGLEYIVLDSPQKDIYTIQTDDFGKVNIYAAPSTGANIIVK
ncbi:peptidoglycan recognition protein family protein [Heyndrickxia camelliae]|uniref:peptidoglycan recognition protein family protein n=1 Tax=Heyndrickxia camelliae TaxID=1707093 RepID=UPI001F303B08|nr:N-acetylmuramoyl-L-alanine amidase [Heyndrickxia camelliae]